MLIGIDIGQGGVKVTALDLAGQILAQAAEELATAHPRPGWAEQDPRTWVVAAGHACRRLFAGMAAGPRPPVEAVGLSAATHHAVLLDARDRPLRPCILLSDGRSAPQAERLTLEHGPLILERARNAATACWTLPQLLWLAEHEPTTWAQTRRIAFAKDYLRLALTGEWATDRIDAEGSLLFNPVLGAWDPELCALISLPASLLPPALAPTALAGAVTGAGEELTGIPAGTPVIAGCSDTAAEDYAAGACFDGQAVVKLATAGNVNVMTACPRPRPEWFTYSHPVPGLSYHALGTNSATSSLRWFREVLGEGITFAELDQAASGVALGAGGILFHPYLLGERAPYWDPDLRAGFLGLHAAHGRAHLVRAILEGVALSLADCLAAARSYGAVVGEARVVGGGARSALWRQIVADALGLVLQYPSLSDASAGAALLAGVGTAIYASPTEAVERSVRILAEHGPDPYAHHEYAELLALYQEAQRRLTPISHALARRSADRRCASPGP